MIDQNDEKEILNFFGGRDEIDKTYKSYHPMRSLLVSKDDRRIFHTMMSLKIILDKDKSWLNNKKPILESQDAVESSSAFGELRTYGNLLAAGFQVLPGGFKKGADFKLVDTNH